MATFRYYSRKTWCWKPSINWFKWVDLISSWQMLIFFPTPTLLLYNGYSHPSLHALKLTFQVFNWVFNKHAQVIVILVSSSTHIWCPSSITHSLISVMGPHSWAHTPAHLPKDKPLPLGCLVLFLLLCFTVDTCSLAPAWQVRRD